VGGGGRILLILLGGGRGGGEVVVGGGGIHLKLCGSAASRDSRSRLAPRSRCVTRVLVL